MPLGCAIFVNRSKVGIAFPVSHIAITPWIISMFLKVLIIKITSEAITPGGIAVIKTHTAFASVLPHGIGTIAVGTIRGTTHINRAGITFHICDFSTECEEVYNPNAE